MYIQGKQSTPTANTSPRAANNLPAFSLSPEERRATCFHEAGHAVVHALGGAFVYSVEVAPVGADFTWETTDRKGARIVDMVGVCSASDSPATLFMRFDRETGDYGVDRALFRKVMRLHCSGRRRVIAETYRQLRAHLCAATAGNIAEQVHRGKVPEFWCEDTDTWDDAKIAQCHSWLLPRRGELERLHAETVRTLLEPLVWSFVERLAAALESGGRLGDNDGDFAGLLPDRRRDWPPPPPRLRRA